MAKALDFVIRLLISSIFAYGFWLLIGSYASDFIREKVRKESVLRKARRINKNKSNKLIQTLTH